MTINELLDRIASVDFEVAFVASTPRVLREMLLGCPEVGALRDAYDSGSLTDEQIRSFVDRLLAEGSRADRFPYQTALAAIASVLETRFTRFAAEYLDGLARIRSSRFSAAAGVARESLAVRSQASETHVRGFPPLAPIRVTCAWRNPQDVKVCNTDIDIINEFNFSQVA